MTDPDFRSHANNPEALLEAQLKAVMADSGTDTVKLLKIAGADLSTALAGQRVSRLLMDREDLDSADLSHSIFREASFRNCSLAGALFTSNTFRNAQFIGCDLSNAKLDGVEAHRLTLIGCNLDRADFSRASATELIIANTAVAKTTMRSTKFKRVFASGLSDEANVKLSEVAEFFLSADHPGHFQIADAKRISPQAKFYPINTRPPSTFRKFATLDELSYLHAIISTHRALGTERVNLLKSFRKDGNNKKEFNEKLLRFSMRLALELGSGKLGKLEGALSDPLKQELRTLRLKDL